MVHRDVHTLLLELVSPSRAAAGTFAREQQLLNGLMGNFAWMGRRLPQLVRPGEGLLELGAGRGDLGLALARQRCFSVYAGVDRRPRPAAWPAGWDWWATDALDFQHYDRFPVVTANLFLHLLSAEELAALGRTLRHSARVIVACEPARRRRHLWQLALLGALGLSRPTCRFARAGVRAGFIADELPRALGLSPLNWTWDVTVDWRGSYRMVAMRRPRFAAHA